MPKMKTFIFDVDGTLIDTYKMYIPAMFDVLAKYGYHYSKEEMDKYGRAGFGVTGHDALAIAKVKEKDIPAIIDEWYPLAYTRENVVRVFPGIKEMLDDLYKRPDSQLAVATSKFAHEFAHFRKKYYFASLFQTAITADDVKRGKPAPDPILTAIKKLNADPATTVYVGDTINDLKAAHAAGVKFAAALYGSSNPEEIKDNADFILETPTDLEKY